MELRIGYISIPPSIRDSCIVVFCSSSFMLSVCVLRWILFVGIISFNFDLSCIGLGLAIFHVRTFDWFTPEEKNGYC